MNIDPLPPSRTGQRDAFEPRLALKHLLVQATFTSHLSTKQVPSLLSASRYHEAQDTLQRVSSTSEVDHLKMLFWTHELVCSEYASEVVNSCPVIFRTSKLSAP